jgi:plastocyanin
MIAWLSRFGAGPVAPTEEYRSAKAPIGRSPTFVVVGALLSSCANDQPKPIVPPQEAVAPVAAVGQVVTGKAAPGSIIVLTPSTARAFEPPKSPAVMDQFGRAFVPELLLAQQGQAVTFRNSENELHSVRVDQGNERIPMFNVATVPFQSYEYRFDQPGFYNVTCDVHQEMRALIFVTSTPYATTVGKDGSYALTEVTPGAYDLTMYDHGRRVERRVQIANAPTELTLESD